MRISEMTTDKCCDVMCDLVEPIANIMEDKNVVSAIKKVAEKQKEKGAVAIQVVSQFCRIALPVMLKDHKKDTFKIIGILCDKTDEEVANQKMTQTIKDVQESFDDELLSFFNLPTNTEQVE